MRGNQDFRPYSSLPRSNDINNYPSLISHQQPPKPKQLPQPPVQQVHNSNANLITSNSNTNTNLPEASQHNLNNPGVRVSLIWRRRSPTKRSQSEDVYGDATTTCDQPQQPQPQPTTTSNIFKDLKDPFSFLTLNNNQSSKNTPAQSGNKIKRETSPKPRVNPLIKYASERKPAKLETSSDSDMSDNETMDLMKTMKSKRKLQHAKSDGASDREAGKLNVTRRPLETSKSEECPRFGLNMHQLSEKRVSFSTDKDDCMLANSEREEGAAVRVDTYSQPSVLQSTRAEIQLTERDEVPIELCDIEPISGTVFRKVTVRRRRQDMRKMPAVDAGKQNILTKLYLKIKNLHEISLLFTIITLCYLVLYVYKNAYSELL